MSRADTDGPPRMSWTAIGARKMPLPSAQLLRFLLIGGLNTVFGYTMFLLGLAAGLGAGAALVAATMAGIVFNFQTSRRLVFASRRSGQILPFVGVYVTVLSIDYAALAVLRHAGLQNWSAQAVVALPVTLLSFFGQRYFVFSGNASS